MQVQRGTQPRRKIHSRRRGLFRAAAVALPLALAGAALPAVASAQAPESIVGTGTAPNPMTTNVPYVAWRGEQIRAVKCDASLEGGTSADTLVEEWSGAAGDRPQIENSTFSFFESSDGVPCVRFDAVTLGDGLARVKLVVTNDTGQPILKHQFLMIWLKLGDVSIHEIGQADQTGGPVGSENEVGDPAGDGSFTAASRNGRVQVTLKGTFPHPLGAGGQFTLPDDWPTIAQALESDNGPVNNPLRWDIHDNQGLGARHVAGWCSPTATFDDVDNCLTPAGADENGPFSNVFGQGVQAAGPFDPARPATLLSDGTLDKDDAPMPAARIDVTIKPNAGSTTDISGVGALYKADKSVVYSRNGNGTVSPHNLYAPYNQQWIPATSSPKPEASGIDGPVTGNNFPGFLVNGGEGGLYDNWDVAATLATAPTVPTQCNRTIEYTDGELEALQGDEPRVQPAGPQSVVVYTDEHGEAQVHYEPYASGFYYDALPVVRNANRGCDLQDIDVLGTSQINATARYPYQPVSDSPRTSPTLQKTVHNLFNKSLSYYPKGTGAANGNARILVAHGNDVDGTPFAGERVCFYVGDLADGARPFTGVTGPVSAPFTVGGSAAPSIGSALCRYLDANGNAAIEVFNSDPESVNVIAEYIDEGLLRDLDIDYATPGSTGGTPPPAYVPGPTASVALAAGLVSGQGTNAPSAQQLQRAGATGARANASAKKVGKVKRLMVARVVRTKNGTGVLRVKVVSPNKTARITVRVGKKSYVRRVATNRLTTVAGLTVPKGAKVRVTLG